MIARAACAFLIAAATAGELSAEPIQITLARRSVIAFASIVDAEHTGAVNHFGEETDAAGSFDVSGGAGAFTRLAGLDASASQHTVIDPTGHFFGSGSFNLSGFGPISEIDANNADTEFVVRFLLPTATAFHFASTMTRSANGIVQAFIEGGSPGRSLDVFPRASDTPVQSDVTGVLNPGSYLFAIIGQPRSFVRTAEGSFIFDLSLEDIKPTPEPATLMLLAIGGAGMLVRFRKRMSRALDDVA
jgi:hypothetical protein